MTTSKYGNFLTILLIVLIVAILVVGGYFLYAKLIKPQIEGKKIQEATSQFDFNLNEIENETNAISEENTNDIEVTGVTTTTGGNGKRKKYYNNYVMLGYIEIPKTGIKYPILEETTVAALETSVAVLYPSNAELNGPHNTVIVGHNYRNGKFFSNNKKLSVGDKIYITGDNGKLEYTIYQTFQTTTTDTSFYARDTAGIPEITLSTCTDDSKARLIIFAKAEQ